MSFLRVAGNGDSRPRLIDESIRRRAIPRRLTLDTSGVPILGAAEVDNRFELQPAIHIEEAHTQNLAKEVKWSACENRSRDRPRQAARFAEPAQADQIPHGPRAGTWSAQMLRTVCRAQRR